MSGCKYFMTAGHKPAYSTDRCKINKQELKEEREETNKHNNPKNGRW